MKQRLILAGGGHGHLALFHALARQPLDLQRFEVILISPQAEQTYSGMLPGWMMGYYSLAQCQIQLAPWIERAQLNWIQAAVIGLDAHQQTVTLNTGQTLKYDWLSLNVGSLTQPYAWYNEHVTPIRPLNTFITHWQDLLLNPPSSLAIIGGGAAGVELAFAANQALKQHTPQCHISLVAGENLLAGHGVSVQQRVKRLLHKRGIVLHEARVLSLNEQTLQLSNGASLTTQRLISATGAAAPSWLTASGLALDQQGYVSVNAYLQSTSHSNVFAIGDVSARADLQRSGVHAVKGGEVLAQNVVAILQRQLSLKPYCPKPRSLYLLACGKRQAVMSWGHWSAQGSWVWRWKDAIDRGFMREQA